MFGFLPQIKSRLVENTVLCLSNFVVVCVCFQKSPPSRSYLGFCMYLSFVFCATILLTKPFLEDFILNHFRLAAHIFSYCHFEILSAKI